MNVPFGDAFGLADFSVLSRAKPAPRTLQAGMPALRFHDNVVVQPEGRALQCLADGPISVCNNQLVSRGAAVQSQWLALIMGQRAGGLSSEADYARIVDTYDTDLVAAYLARSGGLCVNLMCIPRSGDALANSISYGASALHSNTNAATAFSNSRFFRGEVMLNDNQIIFDAKDKLIDVGTSSISVIGGDDVSICNNQCQADLLANDRLATAQLVAISQESVRVSNNYVKQLGVSGKDDALPTDPASIVSSAPVNTTSMNHHSGRIQASGTRLARTDNVPLF
jgi:hypothetical protein